MGPVARVLRFVATAVFASGARAAAATYLVLTMALGAYVLYGGAGGDDLYPGAVFFLLTAPVSIPAFLWLPASWVNTTIFIRVVVVLAPVGTLALMAAARSVWRRLSASRRRGSSAHDPC